MKKNFILFIFLLCSIVAVAQKKSITGIITDTAGEAVIGASIVEVGTTNGTVSDVDGNFTLSVSENASIQVSFIGFSSQTLSVKGKTIPRCWTRVYTPIPLRPCQALFPV